MMIDMNQPDSAGEVMLDFNWVSSPVPIQSPKEQTTIQGNNTSPTTISITGTISNVTNFN